MTRSRILTVAAAGTWFIVFLAVYVPAVGRGFIKDDFRWIGESRVSSVADVERLLVHDNGFYRPVVALSFAVNARLSGLNARGYGLTNLGLALACGLSVLWLARALGFPGGAALMAGALWLMNYRGVPWAIAWTSGRTALLLTLFATLAATALVKRRPWLAAVCLALAMFSKEEAVLLGPILACWLWLLTPPPDGRTRRLLVWLALAGAVMTTYFIARSFTHAMPPGHAPGVYRLTFTPAVIVQNIGEYLDRACTWCAGASLVALIALRVRRPFFDAHDRRLLVACLIWFIGGFAITVFLPVRSDLYACFPSVAVCLLAARLTASAWQAATSRRRHVALAMAVLLPFVVAVPIASRAHRWTTIAELSTSAIGDLAQDTQELPDDALITIQDGPDAKANLQAAFGDGLDAAFHLMTGRHVHVQIDPADVRRPLPCASCGAIYLTLAGRHLRSTF